MQESYTLSPDFAMTIALSFGDLSESLMATLMSTPPLAGLTGVTRRLVAQGIVPEAEARKALENASRQKIPISTLLAETGLATSAQIAIATCEEFGVPLLDANSLDPTQLPIRLVNEELISQHKVVPLFMLGNRLFVGVSDPTNLRALDEIKFQSNSAVEPILVDEQQLAKLIEQAFNATGVAVEDMGDSAHRKPGAREIFPTSMYTDTSSGVDAMGDDTPIVKFVNKVLGRCDQARRV